MKRLLCIVNAMDAGGAETFIMKMYRSMDRNQYQIDFCVSSQNTGLYDEEIKKLGGNFFYVPQKSQSFLKNFWGIYKLVKNGSYESVIRMSAHSLSSFELLAAKIAGAKKVILRSTNTQNEGGKTSKLLHSLFSFLPKVIPNVKIAPSVMAAEFEFGKAAVKNDKVMFIKNAIPLERYIYNEEKRQHYRKLYQLDGKIVFGNVARFFEQKNHAFLIDIFAEIVKVEKNAVLLLVGDGELKSEIEEKVRRLGLEDKVRFTGIISNVNEILSAIDCIVFPSWYEGMPNAIVEAQAAGLRCVVSDTITPEVNITGSVSFLPLKNNAKEWADVSINQAECSRNDNRTTAQKKLKAAGYEITDAVKSFVNAVY